MLIPQILAGLLGGYLLYKSFFYLQVLFHGFDVIALALAAMTLLPGLFLLWFALLADDALERARMWRTLLIGLAAGAVGFVGGYVGPIIFTPGANQGPLLGIFITGPLGFLGGCIAGFIWTRLRI